VSRPDDLLVVRTERRNGVAHVAVQGELDLATAPTLHKHLLPLEPDGVSAVILDLRDLTFIDSTGLRALLSAFSRADGQRLAIVGATDAARRLFRITGTERILDEEEGLRLLERFTRGSARRLRDAPETEGLDRG
jgi:anti-sigma B factor antagonist